MESGYSLPSWLDCVGGAPIKQTAWNERGGGGEEKATALYGIDPFSHNDPNFCGEKGGKENRERIFQKFYGSRFLSAHCFKKPRAE